MTRYTLSVVIVHALLALNSDMPCPLGACEACDLSRLTRLSAFLADMPAKYTQHAARLMEKIARLNQRGLNGC